MADHEAPREVVPAAVRAYLYPVVLAVVPLLVAYGLISAEVAPLWVALGTALLGLGTATAYRPRP